MIDWLGGRVRRYPAASYFVLAYGVTWALMPLVIVSPIFGLPALFGPALAALIVRGTMAGRPGVRGLLQQAVAWRVHPGWFLLAFLTPILISLLAAALAVDPDQWAAIRLGPVSALGLVVFVLVVGEELGWRGFAQPMLTARWGSAPAAVVVGLLWGFWHLPTFFLEGMPQREIPFGAFVLFTVAFSLVAAWLMERVRGSVLIATLLHGSFNLFVFSAPGLGVRPRWWTTAVLWLAAGVAVQWWTGIRSRVRPTG